MSSTRPKTSVNVTQNRRVNPFPDLDRFRANGPGLYMNQDFENAPLSTHYLNPGISSIPSSQLVAPPVPPRSDLSRTSRYSNYNSYYSPYSRFSPSMYSAYGGYRQPYGRLGMPPDSYNSIIQMAEESTRPAFESIESVVDIVGSISMMLESTYHAVYSSYNAILGVVDQFARLKDHMAEVLSFLAILRGLRYLCLKVLYLLKLRKDNPSVEAAWRTAKSVSDNSDFSPFNTDKKTPWPIFVFIGLVIGAPWLMFKLLSRSITKKPFDLNSWKENNHIAMCTTNFEFNTSRRGELTFKAGEHLFVAPRHLQANVPKGWLLACNKNNQVGLIPRNYLKTQISSIQKNLKKLKTVADAPESEQVSMMPAKKSTEFTDVDTVNPFANEDAPSSSNEVSTLPPTLDEQKTNEDCE